jgi:hypothetical protein
LSSEDVSMVVHMMETKATAKPVLAAQARAILKEHESSPHLERQGEIAPATRPDRRRNTHKFSPATMWPSFIAGLALLASQAQALYFYIDGPSQKCFFEELPKDTLVVGTQHINTPPKQYN